jgi:two-component system, NarL family, nitrate/nitrite response regulator NarL
VLSGQKVLPTRSIDHLVQTEVPATQADLAQIHERHRLSDREVGILRCLVDGDANKVISRRLNIAEPTVKVHIKAILRKLKVDNRTQAAVWAISQRSQASAYMLQ